ncbi:MAG: hypothetical protein U0694_29335 [Anaerolineae bacterium]
MRTGLTMGVRISWLDVEKGIRYWKFEAEWTWQEVYSQMMPEPRGLMLNYGRIDLIVDFLETRKFPENLFSNSRIVAENRADNFGIIIIISTPYIQALLSSFYPLNQAFTGRCVFVRTMDEALALIEQDRVKDETPIG